MFDKQKDKIRKPIETAVNLAIGAFVLAAFALVVALCR